MGLGVILHRCATGASRIRCLRTPLTSCCVRRVVLLGAGEVLEEGTYDELAQMEGGVFAKLLELQRQQHGAGAASAAAGSVLGGASASIAAATRADESAATEEACWRGLRVGLGSLIRPPASSIHSS